MPLADEPKIDCHCHVFDPVRFAYRADMFYRSAGQELGTAAQFARVLDAHGVNHALLVGPNSGYETDNRCLLDAIAGGGGRFRGSAVVDRDAGLDELAALRAQGIVGIAFNAALHGTAHYAASAPLLGRLEPLGLLLQAGRRRSVGRPAAAARRFGDALGHRPLRPAGARSRPWPAGFPGAAGARPRRARDGQAIGGISVGDVMKTIWPFYGALIAALLLVTYVPAFSLALPRLFMGNAH